MNYRNYINRLFSIEFIFAFVAMPFVYGGAGGLGAPGLVRKLLVLIVIFSIAINIFRKEIRIGKVTLYGIGLYLLLLLYLTAGLLWSNFTYYGLSKIQLLWGHGLVLFLLSIWVFRDNEGIYRFLLGAALGTVILCVRTLTEFFPVYQTEGSSVAVKGLKLVVGHYQSISIEAAFGTIAGAGLLMYKNQSIIRLGLGLSSFILGVTTVLYMGGHSGALAIIIAGVFLTFALFWPKHNMSFDWRHIVSIFFIIAGITSITYLWHQKNPPRAVERAINRLDRITDVNAEEDPRFELWGEALTIWNESPVFGYGTGNYKGYYGDMKKFVTYPHNLELELLADNGSLGLMLFFVLVFCVMSGYLIRRGNWTRTEDIYVLMLFFSQIAMAQFAGDITSKGIHISLGFLLARSQFIFNQRYILVGKIA